MPFRPIKVFCLSLSSQISPINIKIRIIVEYPPKPIIIWAKHIKIKLFIYPPDSKTEDLLLIYVKDPHCLA